MSALGDRLRAVFGSAWHTNSDNVLEQIATEITNAADAAPDVTPGTVSPSKVLVVDGSSALSGLGTLTMADAGNIAFNVTTGSKLGTTATQKLAFYGAAPTTQPSVLAAVTTTAPIATFGWGFATSQQATLAIAAINQLIANNKTMGLMATA